MESLAGLKTPFRAHGRVTAGNAAGINDGATAALLADEETARELGLPIRMRLVSYSFVGRRARGDGRRPDPGDREGAGQGRPDHRRHRAPSRSTRRSPSRCSRFLEHFGIADDDARVNPYGGAIAMGHPLASSGVRLMTQLAAPVRGAPRGPLRPHHHVHRHRHGRHRDLGEPALERRSSRPSEHRHPCSTRAEELSSDAERVTQAKLRKVTLPPAAGRSA